MVAVVKDIREAHGKFSALQGLIIICIFVYFRVLLKVYYVPSTVVLDAGDTKMNFFLLRN